MTPEAPAQRVTNALPDAGAQAKEAAVQGAMLTLRMPQRGLLPRLGFWLFLVTVVLSPIPDGSVGPIWIQVWTITVGLAVLSLSYRGLSWGAASVLWGLVAVLCLYLVVSWLQSISPGPSPLTLWSDASKVLGTDLSPLSSSVRNTPYPFLGRPLLAALVLTAGIVLGTDRARASLVLRTIVGAACVYGAIGFVGLVLSVRELRPFDQAGALTTFFLNKNTSATYLGSALLLVIGLLLPPVAAAVRERRPIITMFRGPDRRRRTAAVMAGVFLLILLPLTLSRAGVMLTVFLGLGALVLKVRLRKRGALWEFALSLLVVFSFLLALSGESWHERNARLGFDTLGRLDAYQEMLGASLDHPWLGLGLGSFSQSFPQYRTEDLGLYGTFNIGHSTPIELIFEGGYPLALGVFIFVAVCGAVLVRGALRRPDDPYILGAVLVGLLGLIHTSFDFPLQIPGYLITYLAVVGIGIGRSFLPRDERRVVKKKVLRRPTGSQPIQPLTDGGAAAGATATPR
ncbi:O-antigen ligase family protein [Xanthobacter flavus]|uniref:O-antigen ligase family protein n=1 Tax=Xanthobacter flavus TaxID=281 RepID=UPI00372AA499